MLKGRRQQNGLEVRGSDHGSTLRPVETGTPLTLRSTSKLLVHRTGDAAYNDVHLYLGESNPQTRREWITALDAIEALRPRAVVAGHKRRERDDDPRIIEETRQYIRDFDRIADSTTTTLEPYEQMLALYPHRINSGALWFSARALKH